MAAGPLNYLRVPLLKLETATAAVCTPVLVLGYSNLSIYVKGADTTSSGVVTIETADYDPANAADVIYTGTWSPITTVNASDVSGGKQKVITISNIAYTWVRTRISTVIGGGGTVNTTLVAV
jgi:hypothetical protein